MKHTPFCGFSALGAAILFAVSVSAQQTNLIARWSFDEGQGTNVAAVSDARFNGSTFNGYLEGSPLPGWVSGVSGFGLLFDGLQNQVTVFSREEAQNTQDVSCASCAFLRPTAFSVSAWVKAAAGIAGEIVALWGTNGVAQGSFMLSLTNGVPCFELRLSGTDGSSPQRLRGEEEVGTYHAVLGGSGRTDGQWHFVAGTYNGREMGVWWDGRLDGWKSVSGTVEQVDAPIQIGLLNAVVDEVSIFNRALSSTEMMPLFNADRNGDGWPDYWTANYPWLVGLLSSSNSLDQGSSNVVSNQTGNGNSSKPPREGRVWYVNALTGDNTLTGRSEAQAKKEIRATARLAEDGDTIVIAAGAYRESCLPAHSGRVTLCPQGKVVIVGSGRTNLPPNPLIQQRAREAESLLALYAEVVRQRALAAASATNSVARSLTNSVWSSVSP